MPSEVFTFWLIAIPFTVFLAIQMVATFTGIDGDMDLEIETESDVDFEEGEYNTFQMFTLRNLVAFLSVFGWTGIVCLKEGIGLGLTIFLSILAGLLMVVVLSSIFYFISKLAYDPTPNPSEAVGGIGSVYLKIPGSGLGFGKINIFYGGSYRICNAKTAGEEIPTGSEVLVVSENNGEFVVEKL